MATRAAVGTVDDFEEFPRGRGFPVGVTLAWTITVVETVGGLTLASGRFVVLLLPCFLPTASTAPRNESA